MWIVGIGFFFFLTDGEGIVKGIFFMGFKGKVKCELVLKKLKLNYT